MTADNHRPAPWREWAELFQNSPPEIQAAHLLKVAHHEAGHAVAAWWIKRSAYLGRRWLVPDIEAVAISLDGERIMGVPGGDVREENGGIVRGEPFVYSWEPVDIAPLASEDMPDGWAEKFVRFRRLRARADVVRLMAGPIAERIHTGDPFQAAWHWLQDIADEELFEEDPHSDRGQVLHRINYMGRRWRFHLDLAFETADRLVRANGPGVAALAEALLERGLIGGEEAFTILNEAAG